MRCTRRGFLVLVTIVAAGCLVAGCGSAVKSAVGSIASRTATSGATAAPSAPTAPAAVPSTATTTATASAPPSSAGASTPAPTASPTAAVSSGGAGTSLIWLWVLLGVLVLGGLIAGVARSGRRRSAAAAGWRSSIIDAYAQGAALHDAMSVAEMQGDLATSDARARWYDIQGRADDLAQTLYGLSEAASHPGDQARIADVLASLHTVRSAMEAERGPGGASMQQADFVRSRLNGFKSSLRALRAGDHQFS